jgi:hypothetical protein
MICNQCREQGMKSTLNVDNRYMNMVHRPGYYNEDGRYILPSSEDLMVTSYRCSNGHQFTLRSNGYENRI